MNDFYVYVYIDPRSYEEFYYGKGRGSRKLEHLTDGSDSEKARLIKDIRAEGLKPIIKVVAAGLTDDQALLVEKTLIWKLGRTLANKSSGHFAENFRPHRTLHLEVPGFDFANDIYYINVGEGPRRNWDDCRKYGFLSAGHGPKFREQIGRLVSGDVVVAYLNKHGYVGVGVVTEAAVAARDFIAGKRRLASLPLVQPGLLDDADDPDFSEYVVRVRWVKAVERSRAYFRKRAGLYTGRLVRASLTRQEKTVRYVEKSFGIQLRDLLAGV